MAVAQMPYNKQKEKSVIRAWWITLDVEAILPTTNATIAFHGLMKCNPTYQHYIEQHKKILANPATIDKGHWMMTAGLLFACRALRLLPARGYIHDLLLATLIWRLG